MVAEVSGKAMSVLQRGVSMRGVRDLSNEEVRRLETDWNGVFTKLGLMQGQLKARRKDLAEQTGVQLLSEPPVTASGDGALSRISPGLRLFRPKNLLFFANCARDCALANDSFFGSMAKLNETRHRGCD